MRWICYLKALLRHQPSAGGGEQAWSGYPRTQFGSQPQTNWSRAQRRCDCASGSREFLMSCLWLQVFPKTLWQRLTFLLFVQCCATSLRENSSVRSIAHRLCSIPGSAASTSRLYGLELGLNFCIERNASQARDGTPINQLHAYFRTTFLKDLVHAPQPAKGLCHSANNARYP